MSELGEVYLVVMRGGLVGVYFSRNKADEIAEVICAAVAAVPIVADYREGDQP